MYIDIGIKSPYTKNNN